VCLALTGPTQVLSHWLVCMFSQSVISLWRFRNPRMYAGLERRSDGRRSHVDDIVFQRWNNDGDTVFYSGLYSGWCSR